MARKRTFSRGRNPSTVILGHEPTFEGITNDEDLVWEINKSINWYRNNFNHSNYKNALREYLKNNNMPQDAISAPRKAYEWEYAGIYSHLSNRGILLPKSIKETLEKSITSLAGYQSKDTSTTTKVDVQENIKNKISELISELEYHTDNFIMSLYTGKKIQHLDISEWIKNNNIRSIHAIKMADFFAERQKELESALLGKDEQLKEGYSCFSKPNLRKFIEFNSKLVTLLREQSSIIKAQRKPRAKKKKTPEQLCSKVVYLNKFDELKLSSVNPKEIIGASRVILYNPTKKMLYFYESSSLGDGLSIKGTKIINFDIEKSSRKRIRNTKILMNGGKFIQGLRASQNAYKEIKAKEYPVTGKLTEETLIIQALNR